MKRFKTRAIFCALLLGYVFLFSPPSAKEVRALGQASVFVGPASGTFTVGSTFTVSVYVNTGGQAINAIEANLAFPPDKLQVVAPSAGKSLVQIWVNQPTYSNDSGILKFQGTIPSPGINTESGLISTVTFRVKSTGTATVRVMDTSRVLLNDGKGTDILGQTTSGIYSLVLPPPAGPLVSSPTNPDQEKWYGSKSSIFRWEKGSDVQGFSYVLNDSPIDIPDDISEGLKATVSYNNLSDGKHYFHIKSLREGTWGGVTSYAVNVDASNPAAFEIEFSPAARTSNRRPLVSFETTDEASGIDHYEIKVISLERGANVGEGQSNETPFFIEASSPYSRTLELGKYDVVVRAYDEAGNYYQASKKLTITRAIFEVIKGQGLGLRGNFVVPWIFVWIVALIVLLGLAYIARIVWRWHRVIERQLEAGALSHSTIAPKMQVLMDKKKEYGNKDSGPPSFPGSGLKSLLVLLAIVSFATLAFSRVGLAQELGGDGLGIQPPIVNLFPESVSNDEIFYIGGRASAPEAEVIIYIQNELSGEAVSRVVKTDASGAWFYSSPEFLNSGKYLIWTQLKVKEEFSPPSSKRDLTVAPTAIQFGDNRVSYEEFYFTVLAVITAILLGILIFIVYHFYHHRLKHRQLLKEIREAEESIRRGFSVLRRDIEAELETVRKIKFDKELKAEERTREEKLLKDLEEVSAYIGKEIWEVE
ncbi:MAG: cohesin domain-containing protein, partial [Patescibacteria group bacterium]